MSRQKFFCFYCFVNWIRENRSTESLTNYGAGKKYCTVFTSLARELRDLNRFTFNYVFQQILFKIMFFLMLTMNQQNTTCFL